MALGQRAIGRRQLVEDGEVVVARQRGQVDRQAAASRRRGVVLRLPLELRQLVAADEQFERRRAGGRLLSGLSVAISSALSWSLSLSTPSAIGSRSKMPLIGSPPRTAGWSATAAVRWPPADQPPISSLLPVEAQFARALGEKGQRLAHLGDDVGQPRVGRERVAGHGDIDAVRVRAERGEGEPLLLVALPVAAVDEHEQRRVRLAAGK